jgi:anti-anti-sigma factor
MTRFSVEVVREPDCAILRTDGYINNLGAERIEHEYDRLFQEGCRNFIINFAKSPIINSMGLAILLGIIEKTLTSEGRMVFCCLTEVNAETMEIMDIAQYVPLAGTEDAARGILRQGACAPA